ncbi:MAG: hypothetical protein DRR19_07840 [Candidatus Parabeggiatoa sp. nov. 1]|nr:MAG: hypothetical protein DRR19_07840 [Gammaproteobacteria bacterium]
MLKQTNPPSLVFVVPFRVLELLAYDAPLMAVVKNLSIKSNIVISFIIKEFPKPQLRQAFRKIVGLMN